MDNNSITDPLCNKNSELIIEEEIQGNTELISKMIDDVNNMKEEIKLEILKSMLKMHKYLEDYCGDLDVSLNSPEEILKNTDPWYVILDEYSTLDSRIIRYHYRCNWETDHGVEVIVVNGNKPIFVGNCGYASSIESVLNLEEEEYNYLEKT